MSAGVDLQQPAAISAVHLKPSNNDEQPAEPLSRSMVQNATKVIVKLTSEKSVSGLVEARNAEKLFLEF